MTQDEFRGDALLELAAGGDSQLLETYRRRTAAGMPAAYVVGFIVFRGRRFAMDRRAYITDPEVSHLVEVVEEEGALLERSQGRPPRVLEFGVGAGVLAVTLQLERPTWLVGGVELDPAALELARSNAFAHSVHLDFRESDYFSAFANDQAPPDVIFGDPPWGGEEDLYDGERDASYYRQMPLRSAFPSGMGRCGIHEELIRRIGSLGWRSRIVLNCGVLPVHLVEGLARQLFDARIVERAGGIRILVGRAVD